MRMKLVFACALLCGLTATGCSIDGHLYPVQGPAASATAPAVATIKLVESPLSLSLVLASGETFKGRLPVSHPASANFPAAGAHALPQPNLAYGWDAVYGQGYFVARVLGGQLGQAVLTGSNGTVLQVEIANAKGVAVDSQGNLYKVVFQQVGKR